jgi:ABC-type branched-subunit amino acid transport system ATPase component
MSENALLEVENLTKKFGGIVAVEDVTFEIEEGSITGLIGPNGAGKTTTFNLITGRHEPTEGEVRFNGERLNDVREHERVARGLVRTFQISRALSGITVQENVMLGYQNHPGEKAIQGVLRLDSVNEVETEAQERAEEILRDLGMWDQRDEYAGNLSGGDQKLLEIARALMADPDMLLLDEPTAGVNTEDEERVIKEIQRLREERGLTVLIVEHDMGIIMDISDEIIGLVNGEVLATGTPDEIRNDQEMVEVYLGGAA